MKKGVFRNFKKLTGKHPCQSSFFNKVAGLRHWHRCLNFAKFLRTAFLQNTFGRLLLYSSILHSVTFVGDKQAYVQLKDTIRG